MRIAIYGINYAPELTGIGKYTSEMAEWLSLHGHAVTMFTAMPYYPEWKTHKNYKKRLWMKESLNGVTVYRTPLYVPKKANSIKRILLEISFVLGIMPFWLISLFKKKYDIIIFITPPFHLGFLPLIYSKIKGSLFISHIQDLQIDAAQNLEMIKSKSILRLMFAMEKFILSKSDIVSSISDGMLRKITAKGIPKSKQLLFPNWVDTDFIKPLPFEKSLRTRFKIALSDRVILYSGNLGEKQGLEFIITAAEHFQNRSDVHFLIVGSGGSKESLQKTVLENGLTNVKFYPLAKYNELPALLATADLHLVLQKRSASDLVMPSKLTGILSAGGCAIVTAEPDSSLYDLIDLNKVGLLAIPENTESLVNKIAEGLSVDLGKIKLRAREYAMKGLSKDTIMKKFNETLYNLKYGVSNTYMVPNLVLNKNETSHMK